MATTSVPPLLGACLQPGHEDLFRGALEHVQQAGRAGPVADRHEVNDNGDVLVRAAALPPHMLINTDDGHPPSKRFGSSMSTRLPSARTALFAVVTAHPQHLGNPGDRQVFADDSFQRPAQPPAGEFRPRLGSFGPVLPPHVPAPTPAATIAAHAHQQHGRPPSEGFMAQPAGHRVPGNALASSIPILVIGLNDTARKDGTLRADILPGHFKSEPIKTAECGQIRSLKGSVKHEGLAVEKQWSRYLDSLPRPSPQPNHPRDLRRQR
jgi:hypothetical protein